MSDSPAVSVILPTFNERLNIAGMTEKLLHLPQTDLEILIVDDHSPDGTFQLAEELEKKEPHRVRALLNPGRKGLSPSVVFGFQQARGRILVCMDADGQHRPEDLPGLLARFGEGWDMVIGSRHVPGGGFTQKWNPFRVLTSATAAFLARAGLGITVRDPMSGFFAVRREVFGRIRPLLSPSGFKIMLEILYLLTLEGKARILEHGIVFAMREKGESKLSGKVILQYLRMLLSFRRNRKKLKQKLNADC